MEANVTNMKSYELRSKIKTENFESNVQMVTAGCQKKKETMNSGGGHGKPMNSEATATAVHKARKPRKSKSMKSDAEKQKCKKMMTPSCVYTTSDPEMSTCPVKYYQLVTTIQIQMIQARTMITSNVMCVMTHLTIMQTLGHIGKIVQKLERSTNAANVTKDSSRKIFTNNTTTTITQVSQNNLCARYVTRILS